MFCKNCGYKLRQEDVYCPNCNTKVGYGDNHCNVCGRYVSKGCRFCSNCGTKIRTFDEVQSEYCEAGVPMMEEGYIRRSRALSIILALLIGNFGVHNFYLGRTKIAIFQLLINVIGGALTAGIACVAVYIWAVVDAILIFTRKIDTDSKGALLDD